MFKRAILLEGELVVFKNYYTFNLVWQKLYFFLYSCEGELNHIYLIFMLKFLFFWRIKVRYNKIFQHRKFTAAPPGHGHLLTGAGVKSAPKRRVEWVSDRHENKSALTRTRQVKPRLVTHQQIPRPIRRFRSTHVARPSGEIMELTGLKGGSHIIIGKN